MDNLEIEKLRYCSKFENMISFEPAEFQLIFETAMRATTDKSDELDPTKQGTFLAEDDDGSVQEYRFTDHGLARSTLAMAKMFADAPEKYFSANSRIFALLDIFNDGELDKYRTKIEGGYDIHDAVVDAAGTVSLTSDGSFPKQEFMATVERIVRDNYSA